MKYSFFLLFLIIFKIKADSITYYISLSSNNTDQLCGSTLITACPSIKSALNLIPSSSNRQNATFILDDGIYSGINNTNLNIFGYNILVEPLNKESNKVVFDASLENSGKIFIALDNGQPSPTQETIFTQLSISNLLFNSTSSGILNSSIKNSTFILEINNCVFNNNSGSISAIYIENDEDNQYDVNVTISNSVFNSNSYMIYLSEACNLFVDSCSFVGSTARKGQTASVLFMEGGLLQFTNTNVTQSTVSTALNLFGSYNSKNPVLIKNCIFDSNSAISKGGVIAMSFIYIIIENSIFNNNMALIGGSIFAHAYPTSVFILNSNFTNNKASSYGGSISYQNSVVSDISNCNFINNSGGDGGSISLEYSNELTLNNCLFNNNTVGKRGGAIFTFYSTVDFNQTTIQDNSASKGGSIYCGGDSTLYMPNNTIFSNNYDSGNGSDSYEFNHGVPISPNDFNIYCALEPENTYCDVVSSNSDVYSSLCGYVDPHDKDSGLTKGQLAGIIIGATLGAAIIAFAAAWFISKTTIGEHYRSLVKNRSNSNDASIINN